VANGVVYVGSTDHKVYAFAAAGCASPPCSPLWSALTGDLILSSPVVVNGTVYIPSSDGKVYAYGLPD
jgi:outer membrane protein assembly factor BamB